MSKEGKRVGVVLAGGGSTRFSGEKAFANNQGSFFYQHILQSLAPHVDQTVIVSRPDLKERFLQETFAAHIIEDCKEVAGKGPLAGLYSVMNQVLADSYVVAAVDMPQLDQRAVKKLTQYPFENALAVVPTVNGRIQPLFAQYQKQCLPILKKQLEAGSHRMIDFLDQIEARYVSNIELDIPADCFVNINDDSSYKDLLAGTQKKGE
ncbi:molybdenum cofactor guanylyltransferase [Alkalicoccobacillus porphyridii]|uniref:molybdenum cofactor guanylyltransferase n=1 Tax=Alkalicoccobacillus porphyridii TaxID=2597270 RepID=UPI00163D4F53|nr:molybdenum cofactor guanylyltransferase [Alkalicoccobacillus porphyridii]